MKPVFISLVRGITCPAIIILLLLNTNLFSQVTIKERVEINPNKEIGRIYSDAVDHVIRIEHSWTPASRKEGNIRVITSCDDTINSGWSAGGTNSLTINPARGWRYHILFEGRWYDPIYARWRYDYTLSNSIRTVYVDDIPESWPLGTFLSFGVDFDLEFRGQELCYGAEGMFNWDETDNLECSSRNWYPSIDQITTTIIEGNEYVSLYDNQTGQKLGSSATFYGNLNAYILQNVYVRQDSACFDSAGSTLKMVTEVNGFVDTCTYCQR